MSEIGNLVYLIKRIAGEVQSQCYSRRRVSSLKSLKSFTYFYMLLNDGSINDLISNIQENCKDNEAISRYSFGMLQMGAKSELNGLLKRLDDNQPEEGTEIELIKCLLALISQPETETETETETGTETGIVTENSELEDEENPLEGATFKILKLSSIPGPNKDLPRFEIESETVTPPPIMNLPTNIRFECKPFPESEVEAMGRRYKEYLEKDPEFVKSIEDKLATLFNINRE